jgi:hypothetical protein
VEDARVVYCFAAPGALSANWLIYFELAHALMVRHISVVGTNASDATIMVGTSADPDALMTAQDFGDSGDPAEYDAGDFADADYQFAKGAIVLVTIDFNGDDGTAVEDATIVLSGLTGE